MSGVVVNIAIERLKRRQRELIDEQSLWLLEDYIDLVLSQEDKTHKDDSQHKD